MSTVIALLVLSQELSKLFFHFNCDNIGQGQ